MKALKLIILFVVLLGGVVGAFLLINPSSGSDLPSIDANAYAEYSKDFENDWAGLNDWDEATYVRHQETMDLLKADYNVDELRNFDRRTVTAIVYRRIFEEWVKSDCDKKVVDKYMQAVGTITKYEGDAAKSDPDIQQINDVNSTYRAALTLAGKTIGLTPTFNGTSWNSYADYSKKIQNEKAAIVGSSNYKEYLKNITAISSKLNRIDSELKTGRQKFYDALANKIYNHFNKIAPSRRTSGQLQQLRAARNKYEKEYSSNSKLNTLARKFAQDVSDNEARAAQEAAQAMQSSTTQSRQATQSARPNNRSNNQSDEGVYRGTLPNNRR